MLGSVQAGQTMDEVDDSTVATAEPDVAEPSEVLVLPPPAEDPSLEARQRGL